MSRLFGLFADLSNRPVLVVGGGSVAERKVLALLKAGAVITLVAPQLSAGLKNLRDEGRLHHRQEAFTPSLLEQVFLVVAATDDHAFNRHLAELAEQRYLLINVVDDAELSTFHVPAIVDRGMLQIAISTAGAAPALGRKIRMDIEKQLDESVGHLIHLTAKFRDKIKHSLPSMKKRRAFYDALPNSSVAKLLHQGQNEKAEQVFQQALSQAQMTPHAQGFVTLVGAGPGDAGLLTLNGLRALQQADVVLYDRLASPEVLDLARRDAEKISVGKKPGDREFTQNRINHLLLHYAKQGLHVVRLKGGDSFIFGRGAEELEFIQQHGIRFAIVPGITSASACATYAGIPLTHRDYAQSVRLITAHCKESVDTLDWPLLAQEKQTLAFYMGVAQLANIQAQLVRHGRSPRTAFALIENGTTAKQRVVTGELGQLAQQAAQHQVRSPAMLIIGEVALLHQQLDWFTSLAQQDTLQAAVV